MTIAGGVAAAGIAAAGVEASDAAAVAVTVVAAAGVEQQEIDWWWSTSRDGSHRSRPLLWQHRVFSWYVWRIMVAHGIQKEKNENKFIPKNSTHMPSSFSAGPHT